MEIGRRTSLSGFATPRLVGPEVVRNAGSGGNARGEPLWCIKKPAREIYLSTSAASNRLKQAAPTTDRAFSFYPAFLSANAIESRFWRCATTRRIIPGSRLFDARFGRTSVVTKVARSLCKAPKRLPSTRAPLNALRLMQMLGKHAQRPIAVGSER